jgi:hypothetical protein
MEWVFFWIVLSIVVAVGANTRGRNPLGWLLLSLFVISPLLSGLLLLALPRKEKSMSRQDLLTKRKCPHCHSMMPISAPVCATCTRESEPITQSQIEAAKRNVQRNAPAF